MERRVEHQRLKRTCFLCLHYCHKREFDENPLVMKTEDYCRFRKENNGLLRLNLTECYKEHGCCLYDPHKIAALDPDFKELETHKQMIDLYEKKYEDPFRN